MADRPRPEPWPAGALVDPLDDDRPETPARQDLEVWLERAAGEHPLDSVLMDRLRHTLRVAAVRLGAAAGPRMGDPALLEVVLSGKERREDRVRAVGCWGWTPAVARERRESGEVFTYGGSCWAACGVDWLTSW